MPTANTLYRAHHRQAKRASRRLSLLFWAGVLLSTLSYVLVARLFLFLLFDTDSFSSTSIVPFNPWIISVVLGVIPVITMVLAYFDERRRMNRTHAKNLAIGMGAEPVRLTGNISQQRLQNIVEEMAVASGIQPPPTLIMTNDQSINAFVLGGANRSVALTVSNGALTHLTREELQALIAHEFGHLINEDVVIYSQLSAMLHGYYIVSEWRYGPQQAVSSSRFGFLSFRREDDEINLYPLLIGFWGFILLGCGRLIQASFSREREWMADARSVEYTRNSDALVKVLKKALALQYLQVHTPQNRESVAHVFFINYRPKTNLLNKQTHPPLKKRIKRYGGTVSEDEIAALAHEIKENQRHSVLDSVADTHRQTFYTASAYPILFVHQHASKAIKLVKKMQPIDMQSLICAAFIFHSGRTWFELTQCKTLDQDYLHQTKSHLAVIEKIHPLQQFYYYEACCMHLALQDNLCTRQFIQFIKQLITLDEDFTIYEWCYWLLLKQAVRLNLCLPKNENIGKMHYKILEAEISRVFSFCVCVFSQEEDKRVALYSYLIQNALPVPATGYQPVELCKSTFLSIKQDVFALQQLKPLHKRKIIETLQNTLDTIKTQSLVSIYVTNTLKSLLHHYDE